MVLPIEQQQHCHPKSGTTTYDEHGTYRTMIQNDSASKSLSLSWCKYGRISAMRWERSRHGVYDRYPMLSKQSGDHCKWTLYEVISTTTMPQQRTVIWRVVKIRHNNSNNNDDQMIAPNLILSVNLRPKSYNRRCLRNDVHPWSKMSSSSDSVQYYDWINDNNTKSIEFVVIFIVTSNKRAILSSAIANATNDGWVGGGGQGPV